MLPNPHKFMHTLSAKTLPDESLQGGKGANLIRLVRAGFLVPEGVVLTTRLFQAMEAGESGLLDEVLAQAIREHEPNILWAVRSSAADEDGAHASFAGQHDTFLNVPARDLKARVLDCLESANAAHASVYRKDLGGDESPAMAVVLQHMVDARCAGVLFTRHPVRPDLDHIVVEAVPGLGEDLVSGRRTPDHVELSRSGQRLLSQSATGAENTLDGVGVFRFSSLAKDLESVFGTPQDMEWAYDGDKIWILQTRPITTLKRPEKAWSRSWGDEFWAEATTDLQYTFLGRWIKEDYMQGLARINGWTFLADVEPFARIHSHVYFNSEYMLQLATLVPPSLRMERFFNWIPSYWKAELPTLKYKKWTPIISLFRSFLADRNSGFFSHHKKLGPYVDKVRATLAPRLGDDLTQLHDQALWDRLEFNDNLGKKHFRFIRWGLASYLVPARLLCAWITENWTSNTQEDDPEGHSFEMLLSSSSGNLTVLVNEELRRLGKRAAETPGLVEALSPQTKAVSLEDVVVAPGSDRFLFEFAQFMEHHGHRGSSRELHLPRWMDDPSLVLNPVMAFALSGGDMGGKKELQDPKGPWLEEIARQPGGWWKKIIAKRVLGLARAYTRYRENQRYALDYILTDMRHVILEVGRRLAAKGLLERVEDIFFLTYEEMTGLWQGLTPIPPGIERRRERFQEDSRSLPPEWIIDDKAYPEAKEVVSSGGDSLTGTAASPGVARGRARVITHVDELRQVRKGDILVAPNTDSGWTPVFGLVSGLVVQTGGILSHAAIVAREYGIPAATGVMGACNVIRTNDLLEVNGNTGVVCIAEKCAEKTDIGHDGGQTL